MLRVNLGMMSGGVERSSRMEVDGDSNSDCRLSTGTQQVEAAHLE